MIAYQNICTRGRTVFGCGRCCSPFPLGWQMRLRCHPGGGAKSAAGRSLTGGSACADGAGQALVDSCQLTVVSCRVRNADGFKLFCVAKYNNCQLSIVHCQLGERIATQVTSVTGSQ